MHALAAQGSEQKRKACINFTQVNLFIKWYCNGNTLPHNWNLWTSYVIILVQCNFFTIFQSTVIPVCYHIKFPKFVCNVIDLCTTYKGQIIKIVWSSPLKPMMRNTWSHQKKLITCLEWHSPKSQSLTFSWYFLVCSPNQLWNEGLFDSHLYLTNYKAIISTGCLEENATL